MILSFSCSDTQALAGGERVERFIAFERVARRKLRQLEIAMRLDDLRIPPGNRLERLKGSRDGQMSIPLMISGEYALDGAVSELKMSRLSIITNEIYCKEMKSEVDCG